eukprot:scaffold1184_cov132-Cylindrotheca_fusiformis.AAC.94
MSLQGDQRAVPHEDSPKSVLEIDDSADGTANISRVKRHHSDSRLNTTSTSSISAAANKKDMPGAPWKCNLCFYKNVNNTKPTCGMCGTHKDDSFMEALHALDSLGSHKESKQQKEQQEEKEMSSRVISEPDVSFQTAEDVDDTPTNDDDDDDSPEDDTFISFQTAQQQSGSATMVGEGVSTIHPEASTIHREASVSVADQEQKEQRDEDSQDPQNNNNDHNTSQEMLNVSVDSSLTCPTWTVEDSIHTLLNTTLTNDEDAPMFLAHSEDMEEGTYNNNSNRELLPDEKSSKSAAAGSGAFVVPLGDADQHSFSFDQEFQLEDMIRTSSTSIVAQSKNGDTPPEAKPSLWIQTNETVNSQEYVYEKEEPTRTSRKVWLVRGGIVGVIFLVILVSALSI